ncbi:MAG: ABC transporter permease [Acetobacteraceae bacterium]|nr:ABC transporter permease [Acetobacteraceae bacterium]
MSATVQRSGIMRRAVGTVVRYPSGAAALLCLLLFLVVAAIGPWLAPHGPFETLYDPEGAPVRLTGPSLAHPLGTTNQAVDVLSQLLWGARIALIVGVLSALGSVLLGTLIGLVAGYFGGWVDEVTMRLTDIAYGIPFLPFALVVIAIVQPSIGLIIVLVIAFLWRTTARVIRSQVLTLRERPFVLAARAAGLGELAILFRHVAPNVLPLSFLYVAIGVQTGVMSEAALSFLGFGDPNVMSWGLMLNDAFRAGAMRSAWWWVLPPGICLSILVISTFMVTRAYEELLNPRLRKR